MYLIASLLMLRALVSADIFNARDPLPFDCTGSSILVASIQGIPGVSTFCFSVLGITTSTTTTSTIQTSTTTFTSPTTTVVTFTGGYNGGTSTVTVTQTNSESTFTTTTVSGCTTPPPRMRRAVELGTGEEEEEEEEQRVADQKTTTVKKPKKHTVTKKACETKPKPCTTKPPLRPTSTCSTSSRPIKHTTTKRSKTYTVYSSSYGGTISSVRSLSSTINSTTWANSTKWTNSSTSFTGSPTTWYNISSTAFSTSSLNTSSTVSSTETTITSSSSSSCATVSPPAPTQPGTTTNCERYHVILSDETCSTIATAYGTSFERLQELNPNLDVDCTNLILQAAYCVAACPSDASSSLSSSASTSSSSSSSSSSSITSSSPTPACTIVPYEYQSFTCSDIPGLCGCLALPTPVFTASTSITTVVSTTEFPLSISTAYVPETVTATTVVSSTQTVVATATSFPDFQTDPNNCGSCGRACGYGQACSGGQCYPSDVCSTPFLCENGNFNTCGSNPSCYCLNVASGGGRCLFIGPTGCNDYPTCLLDSDCGANKACVLNTCCEHGLCFTVTPGLCVNPVRRRLLTTKAWEEEHSEVDTIFRKGRQASRD